jgi:hypothetical protein
MGWFRFDLNDDTVRGPERLLDQFQPKWDFLGRPRSAALFSRAAPGNGIDVYVATSGSMVLNAWAGVNGGKSCIAPPDAGTSLLGGYQGAKPSCCA